MNEQADTREALGIPVSQSGLKACPFCGKVDLSLVTGQGVWFIQCENCGATGGISLKSEEDGRARWQLRVIPA